MKNLLGGLLFLLALVPLEAGTIEATFVGVNGAAAFGYYVGPYYGTLEEQQVVLDCVDFANEVSFGQQWTVNLSHIDTQLDLANTRFGGMTNALELYQEAARLVEQYDLNPSPAFADIQAAIWRLFDQSAPSPSSGYWLDLAQANYASGTYHNFFVVTNAGQVTATGQVQEFLTELDPSMPIYPTSPPIVSPLDQGDFGNLSTPEPRLLGTMALAIAGLATVLRRLRIGASALQLI